MSWPRYLVDYSLAVPDCTCNIKSPHCC